MNIVIETYYLYYATEFRNLIKFYNKLIFNKIL
jgi:hypothetical protein